MSVGIGINNVIKKFGNDTVIKNVSLEIKPGEFFTLLGPSGCGKTTLLRMIIGFNSIEDGEIIVGEEIINNVPTNQRDMGMVFQNYAIFPHMSVRDNVAFGPRMRGISKNEIDKLVDEVLKIVKIDHLADRMPVQLSGGQQQRVALARAIVIKPKVLLMDEPLSNLDAKLRVEMRNAIKQIQHSLGITTVYVTHDQEEALAVSDRIAIMQSGVIQQVDSPINIYRRPLNLFVANFIGLSNTLIGRVVKNDNKTIVEMENGYSVEFKNLVENIDNELAVIVSARPEELTLHEEGDGIRVIIENSVFLGLVTHYFVKMENGATVEVIQDRSHEDIFPNGKEMMMRVDASKANVFDKETEQSLIRRDFHAR